MSKDFVEGISYVSKEPNIKAISDAYKQDLSNHSGFADQCQDSRNQRVNWWPGKSIDQKKHGVDAKPWPNASDMEVPSIDVRINTVLSYMMNAIKEGNITAFPVGSDDIERSASASVFCRYMLDTWIPKAEIHIKRSLNNLLEKGIAATWVGWETSRRDHLEELDLILIYNQFPEFAEKLMDESLEDEVIEMLSEGYEHLNENEVRKALKELRDTGVASIPVVKKDINRPVIESKCPRSDVIFPSWTMDLEHCPRVHVRHFIDIQGLKSAQYAEGWDSEWVDEVIDKYMGVTQGDIEGMYGSRSAFHQNQAPTLFNSGNRNAEDLVEIVRTIQKLVDKDTGAIAYYHTVWCPKQRDASNKYLSSKHEYGLFEMLNGWDELPIAVTRLNEDSKNMYDVRNISDLLRGNQAQQKICRDSWNDQASILANPPMTHPAGRPPSLWGAGARFAARRGEEGLYRIPEFQNNLRTGIEREQFLEDEADAICGLKEDSSNSIVRRQEMVNLALSHVSEIMRLAYKAFQKFYKGEDKYFRITGVADPQKFNKGPLDEEMDIRLFYDVRMADPEYIKEKTETMLQLAQADIEGAFDRTEILQVAAYMNIPQFAGRILKPKGKSEQDIIKGVAEDLTMIWAGNGVNARLDGASVALDYIRNYQENPLIKQRYTSDPIYAQQLGAYIQQYESQMQQQVNAQTGRLGGEAQPITNV